jgi:putative SOS response-associated peptidase YedK
MCGRYAQGVVTERIVGRFDVTDILLSTCEATDQVRPTTIIPVVTQNSDSKRVLEGMRWGLVPSWSKAIDGKPLINARSETLAEKPSFRTLVKRKRCLIPAEGFYEWDKMKQMYRFSLKSDELFAFAGLYDEWRDPANDSILRSTCIITCEPNRLVEAVHHRMPVMLTREHEELWLEGEYDPALLDTVLHPHPFDAMKAELCVTKKIDKRYTDTSNSDELTLF